MGCSHFYVTLILLCISAHKPWVLGPQILSWFLSLIFYFIFSPLLSSPFFSFFPSPPLPSPPPFPLPLWFEAESWLQLIPYQMKGLRWACFLSHVYALLWCHLMMITAKLEVTLKKLTVAHEGWNCQFSAITAVFQTIELRCPQPYNCGIPRSGVHIRVHIHSFVGYIVNSVCASMLGTCRTELHAGRPCNFCCARHWNETYWNVHAAWITMITVLSNFLYS